MASLARYRDTWDAPRYDSECAYVWEGASDLLVWLNPQPGETILDLGCGTGHLAGRIAETGATVIGADNSPMMIGQAMWNFPKIRFVLGDAKDLQLSERFSAVFSNAVLHWVDDLDSAFKSINKHLLPGGRFVAELGAIGNIQKITEAFFAEIASYGVTPDEIPWQFRETEEITKLLEGAGFAVERLEVLDRRTALASGVKGLRRWYEVYLPTLLDRLPAGKRDVFFNSVENRLRDTLFVNGMWHADYRRLRFLAKKPI